MAITLIDGFDLYNGTGVNTGLQSKWFLAGATNFISMTTGRFGGQCVSYTGAASNAGNMSRTFTASSAVCYGVAFRSVNAPAANTPVLLGLENSGTVQVGWRMTTTGAIEVLRAGTSLGASAAGVISINTWHFIETEVVISDTVGRVTIFVDGTQVLNLTNVDTRNGTPTTVDSLRFGYAQGALNAYNYQLDDLYVTDTATRLGERRVETLRPNADTAQKDFTRSAGADNFALVDDTTSNGDTDYIQGSTVGNLDRYTTAGLSTTPSAIDAVQLTAFALKTDATTRNIALHARSGSTDSDGSNYALAASYTKFDRILETDPATSAAWTITGINSLQFGPKVTV